MAKYIRVETNAIGRKRYIYACEKCGSEVWRYTRSKARIICGNCRKSEEREKQKQRQEKKYQEAYDKGYADAIDEFANALIDYIVNEEAKGNSPYWAVAIHEVSERLKEQNK